MRLIVGIVPVFGTGGFLFVEQRNRDVGEADGGNRQCCQMQ